MNLELTLHYDLSPGWLAPYIGGLRAGRAMGARCRTCAKVSFPPLRTCHCGGCGPTWAELPGIATLRYRSTGSDGDFALVVFDGAAGLCVARLYGFGPEDRLGIITAATGARPGLCLRPVKGPAP